MHIGYWWDSQSCYRYDADRYGHHQNLFYEEQGESRKCGHKFSFKLLRHNMFTDRLRMFQIEEYSSNTLIFLYQQLTYFILFQCKLFPPNLWATEA